jgi:hypothetical protein
VVEALETTHYFFNHKANKGSKECFQIYEVEEALETTPLFLNHKVHKGNKDIIFIFEPHRNIATHSY